MSGEDDTKQYQSQDYLQQQVAADTSNYSANSQQQTGNVGHHYGGGDGDRGGGDADSDVAGKIFVGGLSWQTTIEGLRYYFEKFGDLTDVALMNDKRTGMPRGFGFVTFKDPAGEYTNHNFTCQTIYSKLVVRKSKHPCLLYTYSC